MGGGLKKLAVCDFDKTWSAYQSDDVSCCETFKDFVMVHFSYNHTKQQLQHGHQCVQYCTWSDLSNDCSLLAK